MQAKSYNAADTIKHNYKKTACNDLGPVFPQQINLPLI